MPIYVDVKPDNLQKNAVDYVIEHKKKQVWTVAEIKAFHMVLSEETKYIWRACNKLPNKTSKEILYFYQAFTGLMKFDDFQNECLQLKHHHKNHKERIPRGIQELIER